LSVQFFPLRTWWRCVQDLSGSERLRKQWQV
jgi:hypothetical protein